MGLTGSDTRLASLIRGMRRIKGEAAKRVTRQLGEETLELVHQSLLTSHDIYGIAFRPLKYRKGVPLMDTRRLYASIRYGLQRGGLSFRIDTRVKYAAIQNFGGRLTKRLAARLGLKRFMSTAGAFVPARKFLPSPGELPPLWEPKLLRVANNVLARLAP